MSKHSQPRQHRRVFLKAAGVSVALPWMESLAEPARDSNRPEMRMVCIASALGMNPEAFFPTSFDANFSLSPTLKSLEPLRNDFTVFSHMDHPSIYTKHGSMNSLLSGVDAKKATAGENVSMDQVAAAHVGYQTRFPSVHVSLGGSQGASWTASGIKVREETDPLDLFRKLFLNDPKAAKEARKLELDQQGSVLDLVRSQAKRLAHDINAPDRRKLEEYLTAIREAEERIQGMQRWQDVPKPHVDFDESVNTHGNMDYPTLSPLMFDLLFLAIQSDSSRVFTAGFGMHNHVIEIDGVNTGYHGLTHHGNLPDRLKQLRIIDAFYIQQMARFMAKLKETKTERGNLLDETMVFFGSGLGDASRHSNRNLPIVLAGGGFQHGKHVNAIQHTGTQTPLNNLFTTMLQNFGVEIDRFNNATGTVSL
ncbi:hypothetical protein Poly51_58530 [Rubripirellula tenax]|uniref:DUF1552 domain-containing protein n=1 Tax=Rubripirellula tenax TaxID=2528015 RepID=A0A5C6EA03_9BACT|nr:DUF1552 domain-containing protein [Rubripirellula tenax]TWU44787.1 hypothetical protein Poly51_58530 [Rubripirellula tenax]